MGTPGPTPETTLEAVLEVFERQDEPCTPLTATEVGEELDCTRRTAHRKLEELSERGELHSKKTGARSRIWWRSLRGRSPDGRSPDGRSHDGQSRDARSTDAEGRGTTGPVAPSDGERPMLEQFDAFVSAVEDYAVFMLDPDGVVASWNEGAERIKGYEEEEIVGEHFSVFYEEGDVERGVPADVLETAREAGSAENEGWRVRADGSRFRAEVTVTTVRDDEGTLVGYTKVTRDLTERRGYEEALEAERDLLERTLDASPVGIIITDADGEAVYSNDGAAELCEFSDEADREADTPGDRRIYDEDGRPVEAHPFARVLETGEPVYDQVLQIERQDGTERWLSVNAVPLTNEDGEVERIVSTGDDITELKEHERQIRREHQQTEELLRTVPVPVEVQGADGETILANRTAQDALGLSEEEFPQVQDDPEGWTLYDADGGVLGSDETLSTRVRATGEPVFDEVIAIEPPDGERMWFSMNAAPVFDADSDLHRVVVAAEDVTDLHERARELETELSEILGRISDAFYALDEEWRFTHVNDRAEETLRRSADELLGKSVWTEFPEAERQVREQYERAMDTQESINFELFYEPLDGWFEITAYPSETGLSVYFQDVTDRKRRERELERFRTIVETVDDGVYTVDDGGRFTMVNEAYTEMTGYPEERLVGSHVSLVMDDVAASAHELEGETLASGTETAKIEAELTTADGDAITAEATFAVLPDEEEDAACVGVVRDISERKAYERALEESERRYRTIIEHFPNGLVALFDGEFRYTAAGGELADAAGIDLEGAVGATIHDRFPEDVLAEAEPHFREALEGEESTFQVEYHDRYLQAHTLPVRNGDCEIFAGMLMVQDVTERVEREREIEEQRGRYRRLVDVAPVAIVTYDVEGEIRFANAAAAELIDADDAEMAVGTSAIEYVHPDEREEATARLRTMLEDRESVPPDETRLVTVDGELRHVLLTSIPVTYDGEPAAQSVLTDLTERKEHERELETRARQQDVVSDLGQRALENPALDDLFGEAVEAVAGTLDNDYARVLEGRGDDDELLLRSGVGWREGVVGDATVGTGSDSQAGYTLASTAPVVVDDLATESRFSGGPLVTEHDVSAGISTIIGQPGDPWGVLGTYDTDPSEFTARDVSFVRSVANILTTAIERARYEQRLNETVAELRESNQRLEQFAYIASHDLQEPLRMISNYLQLLENRYRDELDEDAHEFIDFAVDGAERMREMINDLLAYSRVETEAEPLEPVDSEAVLLNVLDDLRLRIEENDAEIVAGDLPTVAADGNQLEQVFQNLVANALKYRDEAPPRVEIDAERGDGEWVFRIADNGIGLDPEHADRIFEVFKRLHTNEEYQGTGIGLALCKKIVERHDGRIWVESEKGEGATFCFTVPFGGQDED